MLILHGCYDEQCVATFNDLRSLRVHEHQVHGASACLIPNPPPHFDEGQRVAFDDDGIVMLGLVTARYNYDCYSIAVLPSGHRIMLTERLRVPTAADLDAWLRQPQP